MKSALIALLAIWMCLGVGCGKKEPELRSETVITPNEVANKLYVESVQLVVFAEEGKSLEDSVRDYKSAAKKIRMIIQDYPESDIAVELASGEKNVGGLTLGAIEQRIDVKEARIANTIKVGEAVREVLRGMLKEAATEEINEASNTSITIIDDFQQANITKTFIKTLPKVADTSGGQLEVATLGNTKIFKRINTRTILWDKFSLGANVTEIKVPATFRYHVKLSEPWKLEVRDQQCFVISPMIQPTTPVSIHTDGMEKFSDRGWARFDKEDQPDALMKSIAPRLTSHASSDSHVNLVREHARKTVAEFIRQWLMKEGHWREDRFRSITVIFADEAASDDLPAKPTLTLN